MSGLEDLSTSFNLATHFLDRNLDEGRGGRVALYCGDAEVTYAELCALTSRAGHVLRDLGVGIGDRVLLALSDSEEFVACWFGALKIGAVVAEAYTFLPAKDYRYYAEYTRAQVVVVDATTLAPMREAIASLDDPPRLLVAGEAELRPGETPFAEAAARQSDHLEPAPTSKDDEALWKFTTGSTGSPKAAVHRAYDPVVSFESYARGVLGYEESDRVLPVPKLFFGYARDMTALFTFGVGAAGIVFPERTTPERIFELIERHRPTILVNVPTMMAQMLAHPGAEQADLSCLRLVVSSGEALPAEVHRRFVERFGVEVLEGIGSSELYHVYVSNRPGRVRIGSAGELVPGYEARIVDDGRRRPPGRRAGRAARAWGEHGAALRGRRGAIGTDVRGRLGAHRRPLRAGRRRVPLVPRSRRRPAQGGWDLGRSARDRGLPARPSPGAGVRGRRPREGRAGRASRLRGRDDGGRRPGGARARAHRPRPRRALPAQGAA